MEWIIGVTIFFIGFIPILYRVNKRIHRLEEKMDHIKARIK